MANRILLSEKLHEILGSDNVYFQSPMSINMKYPCFLYSRENPNSKYADDLAYFFMNRYELIYIDSNPDNDMTEKLLRSFSRISAGSPYISDNLYHYPFDLYY